MKYRIYGLIDQKAYKNTIVFIEFQYK